MDRYDRSFAGLRGRQRGPQTPPPSFPTPQPAELELRTIRSLALREQCQQFHEFKQVCRPHSKRQLSRSMLECGFDRTDHPNPRVKFVGGVADMICDLVMPNVPKVQEIAKDCCMIAIHSDCRWGCSKSLAWGILTSRSYYLSMSDPAPRSLWRMRQSSSPPLSRGRSRAWD